jgi:hypothetical protein
MNDYQQQRRAKTAKLFGASSADVRLRITEKPSREIADTIQDFLEASEQGRKFHKDDLEVIMISFSG